MRFRRRLLCVGLLWLGACPRERVIHQNLVEPAVSPAPPASSHRGSRSQGAAETPPTEPTLPLGVEAPAAVENLEPGGDATTDEAKRPAPQRRVRRFVREGDRDPVTGIPFVL